MWPTLAYYGHVLESLMPGVALWFGVLMAGRLLVQGVRWFRDALD